jgi:hypothetical protein
VSLGVRLRFDELNPGYFEDPEMPICTDVFFDLEILIHKFKLTDEGDAAEYKFFLNSISFSM